MIPSSNQKVLEIYVYIQYMWLSTVCPMVLHLALLEQENDKNLGKVTAAHHITYTDYDSAERRRHAAGVRSSNPNPNHGMAPPGSSGLGIARPLATKYQRDEKASLRQCAGLTRWGPRISLEKRIVVNHLSPTCTGNLKAHGNARERCCDVAAGAGP